MKKSAKTDQMRFQTSLQAGIRPAVSEQNGIQKREQHVSCGRATGTPSP